MEQNDLIRWLIDLAGNEIGQVMIEEQGVDAVTGRFTPGPAYHRVEPLFRSFAEAVEAQALSRVDRLGAEIGRLGLRLRQPGNSAPVHIHDVQLWDNDLITYRLGEMPASETKPAPSELEESAVAFGYTAVRKDLDHR